MLLGILILPVCRSTTVGLNDTTKVTVEPTATVKPLGGVVSEKAFPVMIGLPEST